MVKVDFPKQLRDMVFHFSWTPSALITLPLEALQYCHLKKLLWSFLKWRVCSGFAPAALYTRQTYQQRWRKIHYKTVTMLTADVSNKVEKYWCRKCKSFLFQLQQNKLTLCVLLYRGLLNDMPQIKSAASGPLILNCCKTYFWHITVRKDVDSKAIGCECTSHTISMEIIPQSHMPGVICDQWWTWCQSEDALGAGPSKWSLHYSKLSLCFYIHNHLKWICQKWLVSSQL